MQQTQTDFPIKVSRETTGRSLEFKDLASLRLWLDEETKAFQWVQTLRTNSTNTIWSQINTRFSELRAQLDAITNQTSRKLPISGNINSVLQWFTNNYPPKRLILSSSAENKFVEELRKESPISAAIALGHLANIANIYANGIESTDQLVGGFEFVNYKHGVSNKTVSAERAAMEELKSIWNKIHDENLQSNEKLRQAFETTNINFETFFSEKKTEFDSFIEGNTKDLAELKNTYDQYMSLKAPVQYWVSKRAHHKALFTLLRNWTIGLGLSCGIGFGFSIYALFNHDSAAVPYWKIGIVVLGGTLFFWMMRILIKLMLSNIHLESDAHEREVMSQTYLSLQREQSGLEESDKRLILSTLFRPSSSGLLGDDGIPPGLYDVLTKVAHPK